MIMEKIINNIKDIIKSNNVKVISMLWSYFIFIVGVIYKKYRIKGHKA